jgi:predicted secreted protein
MAFSHGKNAVFKVDNAAGTLTNISTYLTDVSLPRSIETAETTTFAVTGGSKTYVTGLNDATITTSGKFDPTVDAHLVGIIGQDATVSFEYGPTGSDTGKVKFTGECILTKYDLASPVGDVVTFSADFQISGQVTRGTY